MNGEHGQDSANGHVEQAGHDHQEKPHTHAETEHDKLGPIGAKASSLHDPAALRAMLVHEFESAAHDAKHAVSAVDHSASDAVHSSRKALRKARAVLGMLAGALPKSERRAVKRALQQARRALSTVRDHAVAPGTLATLPLGDEERVTADAVLAAAAQALPSTHDIRQLVAEAAARAAAQAEAIQAALPAELDWDHALDGVRQLYAEARRARRASKRRPAQFHAWRRRAKELVYQLAILKSHAGPRVAAIHAEIEAVTDTLSPAVDLVMVHEFVGTYGEGTTHEAIQHLQTAVDAALGDAIKVGRKAGKDPFRAGSKRFAKRLAKAIKRDLTPADDVAPHDEHEAADAAP
ncbi:MAG TPA: CHAD domain-containing protein [Kofleriaceae bacterium]